MVLLKQFSIFGGAGHWLAELCPQPSNGCFRHFSRSQIRTVAFRWCSQSRLSHFRICFHFDADTLNTSIISSDAECTHSMLHGTPLLNLQFIRICSCSTGRWWMMIAYKLVTHYHHRKISMKKMLFKRFSDFSILPLSILCVDPSIMAEHCLGSSFIWMPVAAVVKRLWRS